MGTHPARDFIKKKPHKSIMTFVDDLATSDSLEEFDRAWCTKTVAEFEQHIHPTWTGFKFHDGQAHKWLNMTSKYLAVLDHPDVQRVCSYLHAPVDLYVYSEASREEVKRLTAWSTLGPEKYIACQESLREMVKAKGNTPSLSIGRLTGGSLEIAPPHPHKERTLG